MNYTTFYFCHPSITFIQFHNSPTLHCPGRFFGERERSPATNWNMDTPSVTSNNCGPSSSAIGDGGGAGVCLRTLSEGRRTMDSQMKFIGHRY